MRQCATRCWAVVMSSKAMCAGRLYATIIVRAAVRRGLCTRQRSRNRPVN
jgi:hypothetical protein